MNKLIINNLNRRKFIKIIGLSLLGPVGYGSYKYLNKELVKTSWNGHILNSPAKLEIHSYSKKQNLALIDKVKSLAINFDNIFNLQNANSEIVTLNKNKLLKNPSKDILDVINKAEQISNKTNGAFDVTVQPLWDFYHNHFIKKSNLTPPSIKDIKEVTNTIDWKNIKIDSNSISLINNASITLNGIAQGWITDQIVKTLRDNKITNTLVDFGENYAAGNFENKRPWKIMLQGPNNISKTLNVSNKAVATSGGYGTIFEPSASYHHIFNPKTGLSSNRYKAASIVSDHAWLSDCLATSALLMPKNELKNLCNDLSVTAYLLENTEFKKL
jgi:thiamine biosynthesis lipoprotein